MKSASPSEDHHPEDVENPSGKEKEKKRKTKRHDGRRSQEAKAIATSKVVVKLRGSRERTSASSLRTSAGC